ncbi:restriction endonuclease subunit S [Bacteroides xylanisolvens]|nr:restriction endonuclease subunit S [Bacteroides xylanisolvens]KAB6155820.1 restriction endonuclease subunit S [Bacteroides xylanisolvens]KAB6228492.1 restriction endonuclease subunit S [Bacteroides xylanisolvens]KAB6276690.1 restriction endonuclease subunit S [Bacteroides xylanisolvens]KAB6292533.1 restriction endonuclease subunit S [Bacteroides xylanisolvens]KAB6307297.1 restriction endonuclease subunit S [Bacteroides xylanisolvens]
MNGKQLKNSILQWAIQGKLVPQDPNDEPASVLLERIRAEKARLVKEKKIKKDKNESIIYRGDDNSYYEKFLATGEVKCIDEEIPFEIPQGWEWVRLGNIATIIGGYAYKSQDFINSSNNQVLRLGNIKNDFLKHNASPVYISDDLATKTDKFRCHLDDILITMTGTRKKRDYFFSYKVEQNDLNYFINQRVGILRFYISEVSMFMIYALKAENTLQNVFQYETGTANQGNLGAENIAKVYIPLPPLSEQLRIVSKIKELIPLVEAYEQTQNELNTLNTSLNELLCKSILQKAIQGKLVLQVAEEGTAQELLERIRQEKLQLVKEGKLKKSALTDSVIYKGDDNKYYEQVGKKCLDITEQIPFETPKNWVWTRLSHIANIYAGNSISETKKKSKFTDVIGRYYIGTKDVDFNNRIIYDNGIAIPKQYEPDFRLAPNNSILMCIEGGSAGRKIAILNQDVCFGNKLCCFSPFVGIGKYMYYYLQSPSFFELFNLNKTGIIGGVSIAKVKEILIPLPPIKEQQRIVAQIEKLFEQLR